MPDVRDYTGKLLEIGSRYYHIRLVDGERVNVRFGQAEQYLNDLSRELHSTLNVLFYIGVPRSDVDWILDSAIEGKATGAEMILGSVADDERMVEE